MGWMSLRDRHALVTGASRGLGAAIAGALTEAGARVTALGRSKSALRDIVSRGFARASVVADVTDEGAMREACKSAANKSGPIDILIANAGGAESAPFLKTDATAFSRMLGLNLMGVVHAAQAVLPAMIERKNGRIIAVASTAGLRGYPYVTAYSAAKHAVIGLVRSLALETATRGVTINAVCPGFADTDLTEESVARIMAKTGRSREEAVTELAKHNPQGRLVSPDEVANAVLWLCGAGAGAITGQAIAVAGGEVT